MIDGTKPPAAAEEYFKANPRSCAARVRPRVAQAGAGWAVFHGDEIPGGMAVGWTLGEAFARWEANYQQATRAQQ